MRRIKIPMIREDIDGEERGSLVRRGLSIYCVLIAQAYQGPAFPLLSRHNGLNLGRFVRDQEEDDVWDHLSLSSTSPVPFAASSRLRDKSDDERGRDLPLSLSLISQAGKRGVLGKGTRAHT